MTTKTREFWDGYADMLQGNKELCRRLHQQALTCPHCGEKLQEGGDDTPTVYCEQCGVGWNDPDAVPDAKEV